jgi:hypothetical protein
MENASVYAGKRMAPQVGLEPTTLRLTAGCSAIELLRSIDWHHMVPLIVIFIITSGTQRWKSEWLRATLTLNMGIRAFPQALLDSAGVHLEGCIILVHTGEHSILGSIALRRLSVRGNAEHPQRSQMNLEKAWRLEF